MIKIPQVDLSAFYKMHNNEILDKLHQVLDSGWYILGEHVESFEKEFATFCGTHHAVGVANGTDAIEIALRAIGVVNGDLVATVSHTAVATASAIERLGAVPVYVDINPDRYTMCPKSLQTTIDAAASGSYGNRRIKGIVPVHLYGQCADMHAIIQIAEKYNIPIIEDCSQAHGATLNGKKAGSMGIAGTFSFYPTKNLGSFGDGGTVVTSNSKINDQLRLIRQYGWTHKRESYVIGVNSRLDEIHAAILSLRLKYLESENKARRMISDIYIRNLSSLPVVLPLCAEGCNHVYHLFVVRVKDRGAFAKYMNNHGVSTAIHYPLPVHMQKAYKNRALLPPQGLPFTEKVCEEIISLPMFPSLSQDNAYRVCEAVSSFF